jgi:hypothetical protein
MKSSFLRAEVRCVGRWFAAPGINKHVDVLDTAFASDTLDLEFFESFTSKFD